MAYTVPSDIYNVVHPIAAQQGVPDPLWEDVVYMESGFNPKAHNPSGAYGLFQLLTPGGQGDNAIRAGYSANDLYDPKVNATYGMPAVASAWKNLKGSFNPQDLHWWEEFAAQSGHPGGSPGNAYTDQVAQTMMNDYQGGNTVAGNSGTDFWSIFWTDLRDNLISPGSSFGGQPQTATGAAVNKIASDPGAAVQSVAQQAVQAVFGPIISAMGPILIKTGIFVIALVLVIIGFLVIAKGQPADE